MGQAMSGKCKAVKIRGCNNIGKYGVAAKDVKELIKKGCKLLKLPVVGTDVCLYSDGTRVTEEYFHTLSDNTELVLVPRGQTWSGGVVHDIGLLLSTGSHGGELIKAAKELLSGDEHADKKRKILSDLLLNLEDKSELESRDDDEDWFKGVASRFKTKSSYMKHSCENRIRNYTKEGSFDQDVCSSLHSINPYSSQESRVVFSTWNLDHRIEKGRTIIPALIDVLQNHKCSNVNLEYFYHLLFTRDNLKLVHIVCHNKEAHNLLCDTKKVLRQSANSHGSEQKARAKKKRLM
ncbi:DNA fragmentation factor subunit beta isoform X2 [Nelusetta ayraudi]|uniref:DNA fragmentation factor subunit beta isoform X2 n=1 Tax=Nelusetta ayraudi TaxID=303726 RepID=UPI003F6F0FC7